MGLDVSFSRQAKRENETPSFSTLDDFIVLNKSTLHPNKNENPCCGK